MSIANNCAAAKISKMIIANNYAAAKIFKLTQTEYIRNESILLLSTCMNAVVHCQIQSSR